MGYLLKQIYYFQIHKHNALQAYCAKKREGKITYIRRPTIHRLFKKLHQVLRRKISHRYEYVSSIQCWNKRFSTRPQNLHLPSIQTHKRQRFYKNDSSRNWVVPENAIRYVEDSACPHFISNSLRQLCHISSCVSTQWLFLCLFQTLCSNLQLYLYLQILETKTTSLFTFLVHTTTGRVLHTRVEWTTQI